MNHLQLQVGIGVLGVTWTSSGLLSRMDWLENVGPALAPDAISWRAVFRGELPEYLGDLLEEVRAYFLRGEPIRAIPWDSLEKSGWTDFQTKVYSIISTIPHGETRTYSWVARRIGSGMASRAVGQALRKNPLPILIPCHRIVGAAALGGFMGRTDPQQPELLLKRRLLDLEGSFCNPVFPFLTTQWLQQPLSSERGA